MKYFIERANARDEQGKLIEVKDLKWESTGESYNDFDTANIARIEKQKLTYDAYIRVRPINNDSSK